jgi:hypothetical protein
MIISLHSILFLFLVLTVWTTALPTPTSSELTFQSEVREYYDELGARTVEESGQLLRRKNYPEARGYYDELGARTIEEGQLLRRHVAKGVKKFFSRIFGFVKHLVI